MDRIEENVVYKVCICCPVGCQLRIEQKDDGSVSVTGNNCPRGAGYGEKEVSNPTRIVTSTVRVAGRKDVVIPVKTREDIPKGKIMDIMEELAHVEVALPVKVGDVVLSNVAGTGVDMVVTRSISV